jgi:hypothetical protein
VTLSVTPEGESLIIHPTFYVATAGLLGSSVCSVLHLVWAGWKQKADWATGVGMREENAGEAQPSCLLSSAHCPLPSPGIPSAAPEVCNPLSHHCARCKVAEPAQQLRKSKASRQTRKQPLLSFPGSGVA